MIYRKKGFYKILKLLNSYSQPVPILTFTTALRDNEIGYAPYGRMKAKMEQLDLIHYGRIQGNASIKLSPKGKKILLLLESIRLLMPDEK